MSRDEIFWGLKFQDKNNRGQKFGNEMSCHPDDEAKVHILTFLSSKGQHLGLIYLISSKTGEFQKIVATTTLIIP